MYQATEVFQLLLAVILAPLIIRSLRMSQLPGRRYIAVGLLCLTGAYIFTVAEGAFESDSLNALEHLMYALAGIAFLWSALVVRRFWGGARSDER